MSKPNFFTADNATEKVFLTEDKEFWVEVKVELTMDDLIKVQTSNGLTQEELTSPFKNTQLLLLACIVSWNLPDKDDENKIADLNIANIQRLNLKAFAKLTPVIQRVQDTNFLV